MALVVLELVNFYLVLSIPSSMTSIWKNIMIATDKS